VEGQNDVASISVQPRKVKPAMRMAPRISGIRRRPGDRPADRPFRDNLKAAIAGETHEYTDIIPAWPRVPATKVSMKLADWFETLAKAERSHPIASRKPSTP